MALIECQQRYPTVRATIQRVIILYESFWVIGCLSYNVEINIRLHWECSSIFLWFFYVKIFINDSIQQICDGQSYLMVFGHKIDDFQCSYTFYTSTLLLIMSSLFHLWQTYSQMQNFCFYHWWSSNEISQACCTKNACPEKSRWGTILYHFRQPSCDARLPYFAQTQAADDARRQRDDVLYEPLISAPSNRNCQNGKPFAGQQSCPILITSSNSGCNNGSSGRPCKISLAEIWTGHTSNTQHGWFLSYDFTHGTNLFDIKMALFEVFVFDETCIKAFVPWMMMW